MGTPTVREWFSLLKNGELLDDKSVRGQMYGSGWGDRYSRYGPWVGVSEVHVLPEYPSPILKRNPSTCCLR